ncbi:hypothetical protein MTO96_025200 [Rhipicephalus appendiculatus]
MCVLVRRGIAFVEHELNVASDIDGTLIEIIPSKGKTAGLYLLNVYSTPLEERIVEEQASNRKVRIVEWDKFRKTRDREKKEGPIEDVGAWCKEILADVEKATKEIEWTDWREKDTGGFNSHEELCNTMDGNMSAGRTWKILKHLLEPASTRTAVRTEMAKLQHKYTDDLEALADEVVRTHLTRPGSLDHPEYTGAPNEELDAVLLRARD